MNTIENRNFALLMKNYTIHPLDPWFFYWGGGVLWNTMRTWKTCLKLDRNPMGTWWEQHKYNTTPPPPSLSKSPLFVPYVLTNIVFLEPIYLGKILRFIWFYVCNKYFYIRDFQTFITLSIMGQSKRFNATKKLLNLGGTPPTFLNMYH